MSDSEKPRSRKSVWIGIAASAVLSVLTILLPQLCDLIPNVLGSTICKAVVVVSLHQAAKVIPAGDVAAFDAGFEDCPVDRRLSTGHCLPTSQ